MTRPWNRSDYEAAMRPRQVRLPVLSAGLVLLPFLILVASACGSLPSTRSLNPYLVRAEASTQAVEYPAEQGFDGDTNTRWSSEFADSQWIVAGFDREVEVETIAIRWETARARDFAVDVMGADGAWREVVVRVERPEHVLGDELGLPAPTRTRAIRIRCGTRATQWGHSIWEVTVIGRAEGDPPSPSLVGWQRPPTPEEAAAMEISDRLLREAAADPRTSAWMNDDAFLDLIQRRAFLYFWHASDPSTGLTLDRASNYRRNEKRRSASVAAVGFALASYPIAVERGWVARPEALERTIATLRTFADGPVRNVDGFFPHFVDWRTGQDMPGTEISTIDSLLFLCGALVATEYWGDSRVRDLTHRIHARMQWHRARLPSGFISMGQDSPGHYMPHQWGGAENEGILLVLASLGHPTRPEPLTAWERMSRPVGEYAGHRFLAGPWGYPSIFRYQYPNLFLDFRGRVDAQGFDHGENLVRATLAMRDYCIEQSETYPASFGPDLWGLGAADGLENRYIIHGFPPGNPPVEGTVVVYAIAGSLPHLPAHAIRALRAIYDGHREAWGKYGFTDALNPGEQFVTEDVIGIDQGTIVLGIENHRSGMPWRLFERSAPIRAALERIGWTADAAAREAVRPVALHGATGWTFRPGDGPFQGERPASGAAPILVPDRIAIEGAGSPRIGWYHHAVTLDASRLRAWEAGGRPITFRLGGIAEGDAVYVNGTRIGSTPREPGSERAFRSYAILPGTLKPGSNLVAIRVEATGPRGGIWAAPVEMGPHPEPLAWAFLAPSTPVPDQLLAGIERLPLDLATLEADRMGAWEGERAVIGIERAGRGGAEGAVRVRYDVTVPGSHGGLWLKPGGIDAGRVIGAIVRIAGEGGRGGFGRTARVTLKSARSARWVDLGPVLDRPRAYFLPLAALNGHGEWGGELREFTVHWTHTDADVKKGAVRIEAVELLLRP